MSRGVWRGLVIISLVATSGAPALAQQPSDIFGAIAGSMMRRMIIEQQRHRHFQPPPPNYPANNAMQTYRGQQGPSFDCRRVSQASEAAVCASPELAALDRKLAAAYGSAISRSGRETVQNLRRSQHAWIAQRNACNANVVCLTAVYRNRIAVLTGANPPATTAGVPHSDLSQNTGGFEILNGYDLPYGDYRSGMRDSSLRGISLDACRRQCAADAWCRAFTYNANVRVCILKNAVMRRTPFAGAISGIKVAAPSNAPQALQQSAANTIIGAGAQQQSSRQGGSAAGDFELVDGIDLPDGDYRSGTSDPSLRGISLENCEQRCSVDNQCEGFTYDKSERVCTLAKDTFNPLHLASMISGFKKTREGLSSARVAREYLANALKYPEPLKQKQAGENAQRAGARPPAERAMVDFNTEGIRDIAPLMSGNRLVAGYPLSFGKFEKAGITLAFGRKAELYKTELSYFVDLAVLKQWPQIMEDQNVAHEYAVRFLTGGLFAKYVRTHGGCTDRCPYPGWAGTNEFEREATYKKFVAEIVPRLIKMAPNLPLEFVLVKQVSIDSYDEAKQSFPLPYLRPENGPEKLFPSTAKGIRLDGSLTFPSAIAMPRDRAPSFIAPLEAQKRMVYMALDIELSKPHWDYRSHEPALTMTLKKSRLYADPDMQHLLYDFDRAAKPVVAENRQPFTFEGQLFSYNGKPLVLMNGLPVLGDVSEQNMATWESVMQSTALRRNPSLINSPGFERSLQNILPAAERKRFFSGSYLNSGWAGRDEFARARTKAAFLKEMVPRLIAAAPRLPMDVIVVQVSNLPQYDMKQGGFAIPTRNSSELNAFPSSGRPSFWAIDPAHAEAALTSIRELVQKRKRFASSYLFRRVYLATIYSVSDADGKLHDGRWTVTHVVARAKSIVLYADPQLAHRLAVFKIHRPNSAVLQSALPTKIPQYGTLDIEAAALMLLRDDGDVLDDDAWRTLASRQMRDDNEYYSHTTVKSFNGGSLRISGTTFAKNYVPFFPEGFTRTHDLRMDGNVMGAFKKWMMARSKALPRVMQLEGAFRWNVADSDHPVTLGKPVDERKNAAIVKALIVRGYVGGQLVWPNLDQRVGDRDTSRFLAGRGKKRSVILVLPKSAKMYQLDMSRNPTAFAGDGNYGNHPVDIDLRVDRTELISLDARTEILAIYATPLAARVKPSDLRKDGVLFDQTFAAPNSSPRTSARMEAPITSPPSPLFFGPEIADLLVVKHRPDLADEKFYWRMLLARREYERRSPNPVYGRFFTPAQSTSATTDESLLRSLLPKFEKWTRARAAAVPDLVAIDEVLPLGGTSANACLVATHSFAAAMMGVQQQNAERSSLMSCRRAVSARCVTEAAGVRGICQNNSGSACPHFDQSDCIAKGYAACNRSANNTHASQTSSTSSVYAFDFHHCGPGANQADGAFRSGYHMRIDGVIPRPASNAAWLRSLPSGMQVRRELDVAVSKAEPKQGGIGFDARVIDVRILDSRTDDLLATLTPPGPKPAAEKPAPKPTVAKRPPVPPVHGPDVLGIRIGMTFSAAEKIIRANMHVGSILVKDRKWRTGAAMGRFESLQSAHLFLSGDGNQAIILYDEPPAAKNVVLGVVRDIRVSKGAVPMSALFAQLRKKYGKESGIINQHSTSPILVWNKGELGGCLPYDLSSPNPKWREPDGQVPDPAKMAMMHIQVYQFPRLREGSAPPKCPVVLAAMLRHNFSNFDHIYTWLYDGGAEANAFAASKALLKNAPPTGGGEGSVAGIKF